MKYELQTIPVWRAYEQPTECPLCDLEVESEQRNTTFFLGNSIMAPEMRVKLNEIGFCTRHFHMLATGEGKLGFSLALETHLASLDQRLEKLEQGAGSGRGGAKQVARIAEFLAKQSEVCLMCDRVEYNLKNYAFTIVTLWKSDAEFREVLAGSSGFCLQHLPLLLTMGSEVLPAKTQGDWTQALFALQRRNLSRIRQHLEEFTWQFDYQTDKKTPDHAKDAVPRAVQKLAGPA